FYASVSAQDFFYSTRNYTAIDGLPQSQVRAMVEDKSGYIWIGTEGGGLARFDGREFKVYTTLDGLLTNQVIGLRFDSEDNLWILHPRGVTKFDGLHFKKFQAPASSATKPIRRAYQLSDTLFLLSTNGFTSKIYKDSVYYWEKEIYKDKQVWLSHIAPGGEVCLFLSDGSFKIRSETQTYTIPVDLGKLGKVHNLFNYKHDVFFRSMNGMYRLDLKNKTIEKLTWQVPHYVLLHDQKEDRFWTTDGNSFFKETIKGAEVKTDTVLKDIIINQVLIDSEGNTWFASNGNGLYKYFIQDFIRCSSERMRGVMAILKDREGSSWIGTMNKGLWKIKKGKINSYIDEKESYRNMIHCIKESPDGTVWIGTSYGLGKYDKDKDKFQWFTREDGLPGYSVMSIEFDDKGMWVGSGNGLSFYDGKSFKNYNTADGLAANGVWTLRY
ncbi:MAG: hypothetical protein C0490_24920, partial [Marivirga sp.]|nr:hypothetical protein [Marivirga sp.]